MIGIKWDSDPDSPETLYSADVGDWGISDYVIDPDPCAIDYFRLMVRGKIVDENFASIEAAQAVCEEDFRARISVACLDFARTAVSLALSRATDLVAHDYVCDAIMAIEVDCVLREARHDCGWWR